MSKKNTYVPVWKQSYPANDYNTIEVSLHSNMEKTKKFQSNHLKKHPYKYPSDGFGKPKIVEVEFQLFTKLLKSSKMLSIDKYNDLKKKGIIKEVL